MASIGSLVIDLLAKTGTFETDMGRAARTAEKRSKEIDRSISRMGTRIKGALTGLFVGFSFGKIIEETSKAESALAKLDNAVKNNGGAAGQSTSELAAFSSELQKLTTFSDESVQEMQSLLLTFRQIGGNEFQRAEVAILDLATALGRDLNSSALLVGRALADPIKGMSALSRSGIVLAKDQKDLIKRLTETGRAAEAQQVLLGELEKRFGGAAQAARNTFGGALAGLKNGFGDLLEAKGGLPEATSELNKLSALLADPKTKDAADSLLTGIIKGGAALVPVLAGVVDGVRKLAGGATELEKLTEKLEFLEGQKDQVIPIIFQAGYLEGADNVIFGKEAILKEIKRIKDEIDKVTNARSTLPAPPRRTSQRSGGDATPAIAPPSDDFLKLEERLKEQIALYGKVGEAAKISFQIQSGALDELSKSEQQQVLALAKQYDSIVTSAAAQKELQEAQKSSSEEISKMVASIEQQVAVFGLSEEAAIAYRIAQGDLAATFSAAGDAADPLKEKLIALTGEYERLTQAAQAAKDAEAAQAEIEKEVAGIYESTRTPLEKFNAEIEHLNELRGTGALDPETYERAARAAQDAFDKASKSAESFGEQFKDATFKTLADGIYTGMTEGAEKGWKGFLDAGFETINRLVAAALAKRLAEGLFGTDSSASGGGGSTGGWIDAIGSLFGGGRAYGGDVSAGRVFRVNEREGEYFRPNVSGKVIPLSKMPNNPSGGNVTQNIHVRGDVSSRSAAQLAVEAARRQRIANFRLG